MINKESSMFLLSWVLLTVLSSVVGLAVGFGIEGDEDYQVFFLLLGFAISGVLSGFGQWILLRKQTRKIVWRWIPATALGIPIGLFIGFWVSQFSFLLLAKYSSYGTAFLVMSVTAGLFTGFLQWHALFQSSPTPVWLLLSSVSLIGIPIFYPHEDNPIFFFEPHNEILLGAIFGGLIGLLLGLVSGVNIARVIAERRED